MVAQTHVEPNGHHDEHEEHIHLPPPSLSPVIVGLGLTVLIGGVVHNIVIVILGLLLFLVGLGMWIAQDVHHYEVEEDWS